MIERVIEKIYEDEYGKVHVEFIPSASEEVASCYFATSAILRSAKSKGQGTICADEMCKVLFKAESVESWGLQVITDFFNRVSSRYQVTVQRDRENACEI